LEPELDNASVGKRSYLKTRGSEFSAETLGFIIFKGVVGMTQLEIARQGKISPQMEAVARVEGLDAEFVRQGVAQGTVVIPANVRHCNVVACGVGAGL
jgi:hypothetical protein